MAKPGIVWLVGAGPGDPGLLTLKGLECLQQADVVVHDYLANPELLAHAPATAERLYVGKKAGAHTLHQEEINGLLVQRAQAGQRVVRLKGGDPCVFGRGGEEALALRQAGVPFEIVPGVTAGVAAPAYAGIPVTHRGRSSVLSLVTGHEDPTKAGSAIDWGALAGGGGTLVFYMGVGNLAGICQRLMQGGRAPGTPVAVISQGTLPEQRVIEGTLESIAGHAAAAGLQPPAVTVVGDVVSLRHELRWFEKAPLFGRTVAVTRSRPQASDLAVQLARLGARVLLFPTIAIEPAPDNTRLDAAVAELARFDWVALSSTNAVDSLFAALARAGRDTRALAGCRVAAVGGATAAALHRQGIVADLVPPRFTGAALAAALRDAGGISGKRILHPCADIAPADVADTLRAAGADVVDVVAYRTVPARPEAAVLAAFRAGSVDAVTFTSSSTAMHYASIMRAEMGGVPQAVRYYSIGPETSRAAAAEGMAVAAEAGEQSIAGLVAVLVAQAESGVL